MKRKALITLILGTALAVAPAARAAVMSDSSGGGSPISASSTLQPNVVSDGWMSSVTQSVTLTPDILGGDGSSALMIRSEALNQRYGNAVTRLSPQQFTALYQAGADRLTPQEFVALVSRSEALNGRYGGVSTPAVPTTATDGNSFAWNAAIAGAALIGAMLLALAFAVANRRRHQLSF
jgi:hypothetical protein